MARQRARTPPPAVDMSPKHKVAVYPSTVAKYAPIPIYKTTAMGTVVRKVPTIPTADDLIRIKKFFEVRAAQHKAFLGNRPPIIIPRSHQKKRRFIEYASPSHSSTSTPTEDDEDDEDSPLHKRRILRFEREDPTTPKKMRRTSVYMRRNVQMFRISPKSFPDEEVMLGDTSPAVQVFGHGLANYRRVTRIDSLPMRPYNAFRDAVVEEKAISRNTSIVTDEERSQSPQRSPVATRNDDNELVWKYEDGLDQPYPAPNETKRIVTFARNGKLFIRIFLGPPKEVVEEDTEVDEGEWADNEYSDDETVTDGRSVTPSDDGFMIVAAQDSAVEMELQKPVFKRINWGGKTLPSVRNDENVAPDYVEGKVDAGFDDMDFEMESAWDDRSMSGETVVRKSVTPFEKAMSPFSARKGPSPVKEGEDVSCRRVVSDLRIKC
jgi:hypothetical protein